MSYKSEVLEKAESKSVNENYWAVIDGLGSRILCGISDYVPKAILAAKAVINVVEDELKLSKPLKPSTIRIL